MSPMSPCTMQNTMESLRPRHAAHVMQTSAFCEGCQDKNWWQPRLCRHLRWPGGRQTTRQNKALANNEDLNDCCSFGLTQYLIRVEFMDLSDWGESLRCCQGEQWKSRHGCYWSLLKKNWSYQQMQLCWDLSISQQHIDILQRSFSINTHSSRFSSSFLPHHARPGQWLDPRGDSTAHLRSLLLSCAHLSQPGYCLTYDISSRPAFLHPELCPLSQLSRLGGKMSILLRSFLQILDENLQSFSIC